MKAFTIPAWRNAQIKKKFKRKSQVINSAVSSMEAVMKDATEKIINTAIITHSFFAPSLNQMNVISDDFYISVIREAYYACQEEKSAQSGKKKLASGPNGIPKTLDDLSGIFHDKKHFQAIMRRSKAMSERLKKSYLQKLKRKFKKILPLIISGEMTASQAKVEMMLEWGASKSRVETIFKTETTNYFSKVQVSFYQNDSEIIGFIFKAEMITSTTKICRSRHGMVFTKEMTGKNSIESNTPSLHYNCGSDLIPLANTPENRKLLEDPKRNPEIHILEPLPDGWR